MSLRVRCLVCNVFLNTAFVRFYKRYVLHLCVHQLCVCELKAKITYKTCWHIFIYILYNM